MLQEIITLIPAIAALMAVAGCVWAARAAHRSAVSAQEAARHAEKIERRGLLRDDHHGLSPCCLISTDAIAHRRIDDRVPNSRHSIRTIGRFQREATHPTSRSETEGGMPIAGGSAKTA
jgi:hypothetical protein